MVFAGNCGRNVFIWTWVVSGLLEIVKSELLNLENALKLLGLVTKSGVGYCTTKYGHEGEKERISKKRLQLNIIVLFVLAYLC